MINIKNTRPLLYRLIPLCILLLTACSNLFPARGQITVSQTLPGKQHMAWPARVAQLRLLHSWEIQGSLGVHAHAHKGANLFFKWEQTHTTYRLVLWGPFHQPYIEVTGSAAGVLLRTQHAHYQAKNAEILIKQQLGIDLPISCFADWFKGLPAARYRSERVLNGTGHLLKLHQAGWLVRYLRYNKIRYLDLPTQMLMTRDYWHARVIITHWRI